MRWQIVALGLVFAVAWHPVRVANAQVAATPAANMQVTPGTAATPGWPVQPTSYEAPAATPSMQPAANLPAQVLPTASPTAPPTHEQPALHLLPSRKTDANALRPGAREATASARVGGLGSLLTMGASLVLVLGLFLIVAWLLRRATPGNVAVLPKEVFEILGRAPLASRHQVHMVRCGRKLLLLSASPGGIETLAEIDDPAEVDRLAGLCVQAQPGSASMVFRQVFQQFSAAGDRGGEVAARPREIRHG